MFKIESLSFCVIVYIYTYIGTPKYIIVMPLTSCDVASVCLFGSVHTQVLSILHLKTAYITAWKVCCEMTLILLSHGCVFRIHPHETAGVPSAGTATEHPAPGVGLWSAHHRGGETLHQTDGPPLRMYCSCRYLSRNWRLLLTPSLCVFSKQLFRN